MSAPFSRQLRRLRERMKLTQSDVAAILGVSPPRISEWERAVRTPKPLTQEAIVAKLKSRMQKTTKKKKKKKKKK